MLFRDSATAVAARLLEGSLTLHLTEQFTHAHGYRPSFSEVRSWERSLPALTDALLDAGLGQAEVLIEFGLPLTSKRADAVVAGVDPKTGQPSYVVVELKQWSEAHPDDGIDPLLCRVDGYRHPVLNPIEQVRGYCDYLIAFNGALAQHPERIWGAVYLHNATEFGVAGLDEVALNERGRLFTADRRSAFLAYLQSRLAPVSGAQAADELLAAKVQPSKQLLNVAAQEVREREQFVLLDEQRIAYETVLKTVARAHESDHKEVVVITGGPGTGKSVIALSVLGELYRRGIPALHATGSQSFTKTMRKVAGTRKPEVRELFKYFNSFGTAKRNSLDVLVCDEAHRIRETSASRFTPAAERTGKRQLEELIDVARVPVFLLDQHQVVRPGETGTVEEIEAAAAQKKLICHVVELDSQFRCGGSDAYVRWVVRLLSLEGDAPEPWEPDGRMQLEVVDSPAELEASLREKQTKGYTARISAGFCWPWSDAKPGEPLPADVRIGDWARPWNLKGDRSIMGAPPSALWATDPAGFNQVGCVYTAQGFEYDWSGVIIGPDLVRRGEAWVTDRDASRDPALKKRNGKDATSDKDIDRLIRNTYKVLLTRGMVGTVIYSTDPETRAELRALLHHKTRSVVPVPSS
ncbi:MULTISPECIES: DNA/RNA helicase domain-containing protein [unclassified Streptomyces]|uniref:DNA/RNA helicase domain-containing protein n=1 Tax=unclassified Streptomyces TaxID=2593676 RepID=UPI00380FF448